MTVHRQLAAIMFTDIVGYTSLMGKDSVKALELVRQSKEIQKPLVEKFNGKWVKEMGDGAMASFNTALDAVNCAIEIQRESRANFDADLRIGIHLGDITVENNDIYGDGVNVASRLESIADPGGIYISDAIEKAIRGQLSMQAKYLGEISLKNVDYEVRTFALQGIGLPVPEVKEEKRLSGHFFAEIQRRGLVRAAISYLLLSMLLILLWDRVNDWGMELPQWSRSVLLVVLGIGFPAALFMAWSFERSPNGFIRTTSKESWQNPLPASQRKPLTGPLLTVALALILGLIYLYPRFSISEKKLNKSEELAYLDKSIVVLPFTDMSQNQDQAYFGDGMMEEILNQLVKIEGLKVVSRTTSMQYKGSDKTTKEIAEELGVATVLEGSVRRDGDRVRINVQFIEGNNNMHLFSETYDRQLTNIFDVQSEVAQRIAEKLQANVTPEVKLRIEAIPTNNTAAYELYLKGRENSARWWDTYDIKYVEKAVTFYDKAIALDPEFSNAYTGLGSAYWMLAHWSPDYDPVFWSLSKKNLQKAIELDPDNGWAYSELGVVQHNWDWDTVGALQSFNKAVELSPSNADVHNHLRFFYGRILDCENIEKESKLLASLTNQTYDPDKDFNVLICHGNLDQIAKVDWREEGWWPWTMVFQGRYEEYIQYVHDSSQLDSDLLNLTGALGEAYAYSGDTTRARQVIEDLNEMSLERYVPKSMIAPVYMALGEKEKAYQLIEEAIEEREIFVHTLVWAHVSMYNQRNEPRFKRLMERAWIPQE